MLLPNTDAATAAVLAEALRAVIAALTIPTHKGALLTVTVSIGVSTMEGEWPLTVPEALVERTNVALYHAKRSGRDRVASHTGAMPSISKWDNLRHSS